MSVYNLATYVSVTVQKLFWIIVFAISIPVHPFTIMLDPFGDAQHTGREINTTTFERTITHACVQEIKQQLLQQIPDIQVVLTRVAGDYLQPLQNAQFANRLGVDLYVSIGFYHEEKIPNSLALFYYMQQSQDSLHTFNPLQLYPVDQAHLAYFPVSCQIAQKWKRLLMQKSVNPSFVFQGAFGLPCKPLLGVQVPAFYIEAGLRKNDDFKYLVQPLVYCIKALFS